MSVAETQTDKVVGVILAGGEGRRLGRGPKALVAFQGRRLIDRSIAALNGQVHRLAIGLRQHQAWAADFGLPLVYDPLHDVGPLAGVLAALDWAQAAGAESVVTVPTDCPFIPLNLVARLRAGRRSDSDIVVAESAGQRHHLVALWPVVVRAKLDRELRQSKVLAVHKFQSACETQSVSWPVDRIDPFFNINTPEELTKAEAART